MCESHQKRVNFTSLSCRHLLSGASRAPPPPSSSSSSPPLNLSLRERQYPALNIPNLELQIIAKRSQFERHKPHSFLNGVRNASHTRVIVQEVWRLIRRSVNLYQSGFQCMCLMLLYYDHLSISKHTADLYLSFERCTRAHKLPNQIAGVVANGSKR